MSTTLSMKDDGPSVCLTLAGNISMRLSVNELSHLYADRVSEVVFRKQDN